MKPSQVFINILPFLVHNFFTTINIVYATAAMLTLRIIHK